MSFSLVIRIKFSKKHLTLSYFVFVVIVVVVVVIWIKVSNCAGRWSSSHDQQQTDKASYFENKIDVSLGSNKVTSMIELKNNDNNTLSYSI